MSFGFPAFFWAALALLPLAAVYFIKIRPRRQPVNAFFLWQQVFQQKSSNSLFQRMRNLLSLLLVALAFIAAVLALTKPRIGDGKAPDLLIVIDRSVSMNGIDDGKSRLDRAKELAGSWITALGGSQRAALATVAGKIEYRANLTNHAKLLRDALDGIEASDLSLDPHALDELSLLTTAGQSTRILFLSDMHSAPMRIPPGVDVVPIGGKSGNAGIVAADLHWDAPGRASLFVALVSDFPEAREAELELVAADSGKLAHLFSMQLPARGEASESIPLEGIEPGAWLLRLRGTDALASDDVAPLGLNAPQPIPVQVAATNPFFFQQCIAAFSRADLLFEPVEDFGRLSLAEGKPRETETTVVFAPAGDSPFWKDLGAELSPGAPEVVAKEHALIARIDPALRAFDGAKKLAAPAGAVIVLAHADGTPLLYTCSVDGRRAVVLNFDPSREDFFLSPWFPVLVHDAAVFLTGREVSFPSAVATGSLVDVPGTEALGTAKFRHGEKVERLPLLTPVSIDRIGNYEFFRNEAAWQLGGAVLSAGESGRAVVGEVPPEVELASGCPTTPGVEAAIRTLREEGVDLRFRPMEGLRRPEAAIVALEPMSRVAYRGEIVRMRLRMHANESMNATARILHGGVAVASTPVKLEAGKETAVTLDVEMTSAGESRWEAELQAQNDWFPINNKVAATITVKGEPRLLALHRDEKQLRPLARALKKQGLELELHGDRGLPETMAELLAFDAVVLADVPATSMTQRQMELLRRYVSDFGGGLAMLGSENSFGLGGYFRTPVEEALPLTSRYEKENRKRVSPWR